MFYKILFDFLGIVVFLFFFWRRLKDDYASETIFSVSFYMLVGITLAAYSSRLISASFWFWLAFLGASLGLLLGVLRYRLRVFETIEAGAISLMPWLGLIFLQDSIKNSSLTSLGAFLVVFALIILFFFLDSHYKGFSWYRSGRIGFSGLSVLGLFFLIRAFIAIAIPNVLSFSGKYEVILSATLAFISFLSFFNLARAKT